MCVFSRGKKWVEPAYSLIENEIKKKKKEKGNSLM